jgi:hypothetical protein
MPEPGRHLPPAVPVQFPFRRGKLGHTNTHDHNQDDQNADEVRQHIQKGV